MENLVFSGGLSQNSAHSLSSSLYFQRYFPNIETNHDSQRVFMGEEDKNTTASRSRSEAEKRRRDGINAQLATLRRLIPNSEKMDKATVLGSAIEHVKELRKNAIEINKVITIPSDVDELIIEDSLSEAGYKMKSNIFMKVSFCCEDRPELFGDLSRVLEGLNLRIVEAELTCLAGRIKCVFCITAMDSLNQENDCMDSLNQGNVCMDSLKKSLKQSLNRVIMSSSTSNYIIKSKRRRLLFPQCD